MLVRNAGIPVRSSPILFAVAFQRKTGFAGMLLFPGFDGSVALRSTFLYKFGEQIHSAEHEKKANERFHVSKNICTRGEHIDALLEFDGPNWSHAVSL